MKRKQRKVSSRSRLILGAFDSVSALIVAALLSCAFVTPAWAYVDPSVMTYTIQAVAGVAVALSAVAGVALRRTRRWLLAKLQIDENANKEIDPTVFRVEGDSENIKRSSEYFQALAADADMQGDAAGESGSKHAFGKNRGQGARDLTWRQRLLPAFLVVLFCGFTLGIAAPFEIVAGAAGDLKFGLGDVWSIMTLFTLAAIVVATLVLSAFHGKAFMVALVVVFCFGLCCYIQALALNGGLPPADGRDIDWWGEHGPKMVATGIMWLVVLVVPAVLCLRNARISRLAVCALAIALVIVQGVGVASLFVSNKGISAGVANPEFCTEDGLYDVSPDNNVIVFILDNFDTHAMDVIAQDYPEALSGFDGFTWYRNNAGVMVPTSFAMPYLLTGEMPTTDETVPEYLHRRYLESSFLKDLHATGWSVGIYSDTFSISSLSEDECTSAIYDNIDNFHALEKLDISAWGTIKALVKVSLYRDMPWVLKNRFWFYTDELNDKVLDLSQDSQPSETVYVIDDARYLQRMQSMGLNVDDRGKTGSFRLIHLEGAHTPFVLDENGVYVGTGASDQLTQARGVLHIVDTYLGMLKDLGLYDSATVMIMSDHGDWQASMDMPTFEIEPILLYKPANSAVQGMSVSSAPTSHTDFHGTVLEAMGAQHDAYPSTYASIAEGAQRIRPFYHITHDDNSFIKSLLRYEIDGDVLDFANWHYTGDVWPCDYDNDLK